MIALSLENAGLKCTLHGGYLFILVSRRRCFAAATGREAQGALLLQGARIIGTLSDVCKIWFGAFCLFYRREQNTLSTLANSPSVLRVRMKRPLKMSRFQWLAFGGAVRKRRASRSRVFRRGRETTGWPKDKHRLSTAVRFFSCKCALLGLAGPKSTRLLIFNKLKPVDQ